MKGRVKNPFKPIVYGVGYFGFKDSRIKNKHPSFNRIYIIWKDMLRRCYSTETIYKIERVVVCSSWFSFKNFYEWVISKHSNYDDDLYLDKDILQLYGPKKYSAETCIFVTRQMNNVFVRPRCKRRLPIGVTQENGKFKASITRNKMFLGRYSTILESYLAYKLSKREYVLSIARRDFFNKKIPFNIYKFLYDKYEWIEEPYEKSLINSSLSEVHTTDFIRSNIFLENFITKMRLETIES